MNVITVLKTPANLLAGNEDWREGGNTQAKMGESDGKGENGEQKVAAAPIWVEGDKLWVRGGGAMEG